MPEKMSPKIIFSWLMKSTNFSPTVLLVLKVKNFYSTLKYRLSEEVQVTFNAKILGRELPSLPGRVWGEKPNIRILSGWRARWVRTTVGL